MQLHEPIKQQQSLYYNYYSYKISDAPTNCKEKNVYCTYFLSRYFVAFSPLPVIKLDMPLHITVLLNSYLCFSVFEYFFGLEKVKHQARMISAVHACYPSMCGEFPAVEFPVPWHAWGDSHQ